MFNMARIIIADNCTLDPTKKYDPLNSKVHLIKKNIYIYLMSEKYVKFQKSVKDFFR